MVGTSWTAANEQRAFVWRDGVMANLGVLPGDELSIGIGINDRGEVLGISVMTSVGGAHSYRSFVWSDGVMTELEAPTGRQAYPAGINDRGMVTGRTCLQLGGICPFVWEDGVMTELPTASGRIGWPRAINDRDQVVGRSSARRSLDSVSPGVPHLAGHEAERLA